MLATSRILVCDDQPLIRAGLQSVLPEHPDLAIVGEAVDGREYVAKDAPLSELVEAVRAVARGGRYLSSAVLETMVGIPPGAAPVRSRYELLTDREREVLKLVADGLSVKEIAARLGRTVKTAEV